MTPDGLFLPPATELPGPTADELNAARSALGMVGAVLGVLSVPPTRKDLARGWTAHRLDVTCRFRGGIEYTFDDIVVWEKNEGEAMFRAAKASKVMPSDPRASFHVSLHSEQERP